MNEVLIIAPKIKLNDQKLQKVIIFFKQHGINIQVDDIPQKVAKFPILQKSQYYDHIGFLPQSILYNRDLTFKQLQNSQLTKFLPFQKSQYFIIKSNKAAGDKLSHKMRISESFDPDNHCQSLIDTDIMIKAYCVFEELVYAEARIQKQLPINFDSQIDKSKIYGINISVSALIYQQLRLISQQLYSIFKLDLLAFDCVISKNNKLFIVDLNYFTHDSIDCSLWALQWYARSKEQKIL